MAQAGDWIVGTGSAANKRAGYLVYAMKVSEAITFDEYWSDPRFLLKRPSLRSSKKLAFGDNIYSRANGKAQWSQLDSHHSMKDGSPNPRNIANDTQTNRVIIGAEFVYWGAEGPKIPESFRNCHGQDVCAGRGHKSKFSQALVNEFVAWILSDPTRGYSGEPADWKKSP